MLRITCKICHGSGLLRLEDDPFCAMECSTCNGTGKMIDFSLTGVRPKRMRKPWFQSLAAGLIIIAALWCATTSWIFSALHPEQTQMQVFLHIPQSFVLEFEL